ncbi:hypothetical protein [Streptomyces sp. NPDC007172]|uniref:hypothetical protein n=1 Tax=unclassified Streptomyces TaxID=2593676 RepID=UPI003674A229
MGVFSRFRRKAAEASTEEAAGSTPTAGPEAGAGSDAAEAPAAEAREVSEGAEESGVAEPAGTAAEGVEIPKQQSAEAAADNEAGEGVRK